MPYISKHERARGGYAAKPAPTIGVRGDTPEGRARLAACAGAGIRHGRPPALDHERDWSIPTDMETLQARLLPTPDQSRYGTATTDPLGREGPGWKKGANGLPVKVKDQDQA